MGTSEVLTTTASRVHAPAYDVAVVGLGAMGSATAYQLARRGLRVVAVEQFEPGHDRGSSSGGSRMIRRSYFEDPAYVPLVERAYALWRDLERETGESLLVRAGGLYLGPDGSRTVAGALASARRWGLPHSLLDAAGIRQRYPVLTPAAGTMGLGEPDAGFVRPERAIRAYVALARQAGAEIRTGERVLGWDLAAGGVRVHVGESVLVARRLVVTAGPWAPPLLPDLPTPLTVERQVQYWFRPPESRAFSVGTFPCWIWETAGVQLYGFPEVDDAGVKVGIFRLGTATTADGVCRTVSGEEVERMRALLAGCVPALARAPLVKAQTCLYTTSYDEHFLVGPYPGAPEVIVATGFSGHGFKFAPVLGEAMADLVSSGTTRHDLSLFAPDRKG